MHLVPVILVYNIAAPKCITSSGQIVFKSLLLDSTLMVHQRLADSSFPMHENGDAHEGATVLSSALALVSMLVSFVSCIAAVINLIRECAPGGF